MISRRRSSSLIANDDYTGLPRADPRILWYLPAVIARLSYLLKISAVRSVPSAENPTALFSHPPPLLTCLFFFFFFFCCSPRRTPRDCSTRRTIGDPHVASSSPNVDGDRRRVAHRRYRRLSHITLPTRPRRYCRRRRRLLDTVSSSLTARSLSLLSRRDALGPISRFALTTSLSASSQLQFT